MISTSVTVFGLSLLAFHAPLAVVADADGLRAQAPRLHDPDHSTFLSSPIASLIPDVGSFFKSVGNDPGAVQEAEDSVQQEADEIDSVMEVLDSVMSDNFMSMPPTFAPTVFATSTPVPAVSDQPSTSPTISPAPTVTDATPAPTIEGCGIPEEDRIAGILAELDAVADPALIRDNSTPQGLATTWLIEVDGKGVCPGDEKCGLVQRWVLAVIYFSTGGEEWLQCSSNPDASDDCGSENPFVGAERYLSDFEECVWAGISCDSDECVTQVVFEENNLVGTIPTEIGLLSGLAMWGMERGGLTGPIPTEIGNLKDLIFLDLDFNQITGSISSELLSLTSLTQLDLNDNELTGSVIGIGVFPQLEFLQLHNNLFTGTIPESLGDSTKLTAFTLHGTAIGGTMPESICDLLATRDNGGVLGSLIADCSRPDPDIVCTCCTDCRNT